MSSPAFDQFFACVKIVTSSQADALKEEIARFPKDWLRIIDQPKRFYTVRVEPVSIARSYGEPLLARVAKLSVERTTVPYCGDGPYPKKIYREPAPSAHTLLLAAGRPAGELA